MIRMRALNVESSEESENEEDIPTVTKEAQEHSAFTQYNEALTFLGENDLDSASEILRALLQKSFLADYKVPEGAENSKQPALMLKYSCLKNLANVLVKQGDVKSAIEYYLQASHLDGTDVSLWYRIGTLAIEVVDYKLAVDAFLEGLHYSPRHWPCLENAITMLFVTNDYNTCLYFVSIALALDPGCLKGLAFRDRICIAEPCNLEIFKAYHPDRSLGEFNEDYDKKEAAAMVQEAQEMKYKMRDKFKHLFEPEVLPTIGLLKPLTAQTWFALAEGLSLLHNHMVESQISLLSPISLKECLPVVANEVNGDQDMEVQVEETPKEVVMEVVEEKEAEPPVPPPDDEEAEEARGKKRRRSFLEQWMWGGKRRSARVRSTARGKDADDNLGQVLRSLVPPSLLPCNNSDIQYLKYADDSQDTMELYKLFDKTPPEVDSTCKTSGPQAEGYFGTEAEYKDVEQFVVNAGDRLGDIVMDLLMALSVKWQMCWPAGLTRLYKSLYTYARSFHVHPSIFSEPSDWIMSNALVTLVNAELMMDDQPVNARLLCEELGQAIPFIVNSDLSRDHSLRCYWLNAHVLLALDHHVEQAIAELEAVVDVVESEEGPKEVKLENCITNPLINAAVANKLLATLTRSKSLCQVQQLNDSGNYEALVDILKGTLENGCESKPSRRIEETELIPDRYDQLVMLVEALSHLENHKDTLYCGEACLNEALNNYLNCADSSSSQQLWSETVTIIVWYMMSWVDNIGLTLLDTINTGRLSRLVQNLTHIVCHQLDVGPDTVAMPIETVLPWILLQRILEHCEASATLAPPREGDEEEEEEEIPASIRILIIAHDHLAKRSWCCSNEGSLLLHMFDVIVPKLNDATLAASRDELTTHVEQAVFCLYAHVSRKTKKSVAAMDHGVPHIPLTWVRAVQLYQMYRPIELPEFDGYRERCITADTEVLLKRFTTLVPMDCDPAPVFTELKRYIDGHTDELPTARVHFPQQIASLYYVLADYYFKNSEWSAASKHYMLDLCVNPRRLDSWAGCALSLGSRLETALNSCAMTFSDVVFLQRAVAAQRCYQRALEIDNEHSLLWIEFGSFVYMVHSFCCRLLKQENEGMSMQTFVQVETQKEEMLKLAVKCFSTANKAWYQVGEAQGAQDERWLHHYMLGKAAEKRGSEPGEFLVEYEQCVDYLHASGAEYPRRVSYSNPQNLAVEALEVYYRIHASILKYLEVREGKGVKQHERIQFHAYIDRAMKGPFMMREGKDTEEETRKRTLNEQNMEGEALPAKQPRLETDEQMLAAVKDVMEDMIAKVIQECKSLDMKDRFLEISEVEIMPINVSDNLNRNAALEITIGAKWTERKEEVVQKADDEVALTRDEICDIIGVQLTPDPPQGEVFKCDSNSVTEEVELKTEKFLDDRDGVIKSTIQVQEDGREELTEKEGRRESTATTGESTVSSSSDEDSSDSDSSDSTSSDQSGSTRSQEEQEAGKDVAEKQEAEQLILDNWDVAMKCLKALEQCVLRFPTHYKSLYRLAHFYFRSKQWRNLQSCRELLLGSYCCSSGQTVQGLFSERKANNFFNGVWRIPASEIDRAGSFASHMSRCVQLLMELLTEERDHALLLDICIQLRRTPDTDKKYLRDTEREQLYRQAFTLCLRALRSKIDGTKNANKSKTGDADKADGKTETDGKKTEDVTKSLVIDVYKCYRRTQKHLEHKEKVFASLLLDAYKKHTKIAGSSLDSVVRWCQQECAAMRAANLATATLPVPAVTKLPTPLKPPGARSRGRPPNVPRPSTGFEYPKAWSGSTQQPMSVAEQQYANMLAQNMASISPYYHPMLNMAGLAGYNMPSSTMLDQQIKAFNMLNYQVQMGNYQTELMRHYGTIATPVTKTSPKPATPSTSARPVVKQSKTPQTSSSVKTPARTTPTVKPSTSIRNPSPASGSVLQPPQMAQVPQPSFKPLSSPKPSVSKTPTFAKPSSRTTIEIATAQLLQLTSKNRNHGVSLTAIDSTPKQRTTSDKAVNLSPFSARNQFPYPDPRSHLHLLTPTTTPANFSQLGSEITVTSTNPTKPLRLPISKDDSHLEIASKPLDLAAIPKGITITNVHPIQQKKADGRVQKPGLVKLPIAKKPIMEKPNQSIESVETITLD